ncbi:MAG: hypothetical protein EA350_01290 [Gemmatimonadales bacterium]|nr:MAG: hypothetical protein EA350_01290 [Gemmatimonadales bacterium]
MSTERTMSTVSNVGKGVALGLAPALALALGMALALFPSTVAAGPAAAAGEALEGSDPERIVARLADAETRGEAEEELLVWIRELPPERASLWLRLAAAVDRLPPDQVGAAAHAVLLSDPVFEADPVRQVAAARELRDAALELHPSGQPVLLALAAHLLEPEAPGEALDLRRRYLAGGFEGPEAGEVVMAVARALLDGPAPVDGSTGVSDEAPADEARRILEEFLEGAPEHPMAPEARRLRALAVRAGEGS